MERVAVEEGSKPRREGVSRALRFCVIESSVVARERRRKSVIDVRLGSLQKDRRGRICKFKLKVYLGEQFG